MKHIIIDTNVVHLDYQLTGVRITGLCSSCERLNHRVFIPEVVIDEMVKQYRDEVNECTEQINNALNKLKKRNVQIQLQSIDSALITSGYERKLRDRINILGIHVIPYPKTTHKEMVARELNRRKPFKDSTKGYRDSLIWESIKEYCKQVPKRDDIVFLTENSDDFASKDKKTFHPDLIEDCVNAGIDQDHIQLVTGVYKYVENEIIGRFEELQELFQELCGQNGVGDIDVRQEIRDYVDKKLISYYVAGDIYGESMSFAPGYYENPEVMEMEIGSIRYDSIRELSHEQILIQSTVVVKAEIDAFIYKGDLPLIDDNSLPYIFDDDWNEHYVTASDSATFTLSLNIVCDKDLTDVLNIEDEVMRVDYKTGYHFEA